MAETKEEIAAERDQLRAELERTQGELAAARAGGASQARVTMVGRPEFGLSEGERQALEANGVANSAFDGRLLLADDYGIEVKTDLARRNIEHAREAAAKANAGTGAIWGVDFVYPSVAPGVLDPEAVQRGDVRGAQPASAVEPIDGDSPTGDRV